MSRGSTVFEGFSPAGNIAAKCHRLEMALERLRFPLGLAPPELVPAIEKTLDEMEAQLNALYSMTHPDPRRVRFLQGAERANSLILAIESLAHSRPGGLYPADSLHSAAVDHALTQDKIWWHQQSQGLIVGMLRAEPEIIAELEKRGIRVWEGKRRPLIPGDDLWRIVDQRPESHGDIWRRIAGPRKPGLVCARCGIIENPRADELRPFELERWHGATVLNGTVVHTGGGVLVHDECRALYAEDLKIHAGYPSAEAAELADAATGRKSRRGAPRPSVPALELQKPISEPPPRDLPADGSDPTWPGGDAA